MIRKCPVVLSCDITTLLPPPSYNFLPMPHYRPTSFFFSAHSPTLISTENTAIAEDFRVKGIWGEDVVWQQLAGRGVLSESVMSGAGRRIKGRRSVLFSFRMSSFISESSPLFSRF